MNIRRRKLSEWPASRPWHVPPRWQMAAPPGQVLVSEAPCQGETCACQGTPRWRDPPPVRAIIADTLGRMQPRYQKKCASYAQMRRGSGCSRCSPPPRQAAPWPPALWCGVDAVAEVTEPSGPTERSGLRTGISGVVSFVGGIVSISPTLIAGVKFCPGAISCWFCSPLRLRNRLLRVFGRSGMSIGISEK